MMMLVDGRIRVMLDWILVNDVLVMIALLLLLNRN